MYLTIIIIVCILILSISIMRFLSYSKKCQYEKECSKRLEKIRMDIERKNKGGSFESSYKRGKEMRKEMYRKLGGK